MGKENKSPYKAFGARLKFLREQWQQSISEVSGTLEIKEAELQDIESGKIMPPEDTLDMLINHFLLTEDQADDLRDLALQQSELASDILAGGLEDMLMKQIVMYLPVDNKVIYTDGMNATVNNHGVILQFTQPPQNANSKGQPMIVSRIGMSRDHAERMLKVLRDTLDQHDKANDSRFLPSPKEDQTDK